MACGAPPESHLRLSLNPVWRFHSGDAPGDPFAFGYKDSGWDLVSLPHSLALFPVDLKGYDQAGRGCGWYRRVLEVPAAWRGKRFNLEFQGAMQATALWVNGEKAGEYAVSGYDSFSFDITRWVKPGKNVLAVRVDNRPNPDLPPDGQEMDYVLFGGLYRDVFLHVTDDLHLTFPWEARQAGIRVTQPEVSADAAVVRVEATVRNDGTQAHVCSVVQELRDPAGQLVATLHQQREVPAGGEATFDERTEPLPKPRLWSPEDPALYEVLTLVRCAPAGGGPAAAASDVKEVDRWRTRVGIRWVRFDREQGFFLNGRPVKLVGANRHQSWPFIGYAVPNGLHRRDADQLKAMGLNWVRLSHYPQDPDFLDALDELGLMALAEPPTWNTTGGAAWKTNLVASFRSMIRRDRNHPCVILWNASVNHHPGDAELVEAAREEDPGRDRGGDTVGLAMDFFPLRISGHGALSIEHTGHTYPAARGARNAPFHLRSFGQDHEYNPANREYDQARRQWEQVNAAMQVPANAGLAVWCMFDYNTFYNTNEPGLVWHGVCDLFRLPKFSYWWHVSELTTAPMAYVVRVDATNAVVFSNCERVRLRQDTGAGYGEPVTQVPETGFHAERVLPRRRSATPTPDQPAAPWREVDSGTNWVNYALHHPPFHFAVASGTRALKAEGLVGTRVAATNEWKQPGSVAALVVEADRPVLTADGADLSRIIVSAVDAAGTCVDTADAQVTFSIQGLGQLIGENPVRLRAGKMIILAQSAFVPGKMVVTAQSPGLRSASVSVETRPVSTDVDMPKHLPARQPTRRVFAAATQDAPARK